MKMELNRITSYAHKRSLRYPHDLSNVFILKTYLPIPFFIVSGINRNTHSINE